MPKRTRAIALIQLLLVLPAALFLTSVLVAAGHSPQFELGNVAERIVVWFSARIWTFWLLLLGLPFAVFAAGFATLAHRWNHHAGPNFSLSMIPAPLATLLVGGLTLSSAGILAVVVLHMLAN